jgi:hypothetical protein
VSYPYRCPECGTDMFRSLPGDGPGSFRRLVCDCGHDCGPDTFVTGWMTAQGRIAELEYEVERLRCCFLCAHYSDGFCLWCATPSNGLARPVHPRSVKCRCTPDRWMCP